MVAQPDGLSEVVAQPDGLSEAAALPRLASRRQADALNEAAAPPLLASAEEPALAGVRPVGTAHGRASLISIRCVMLSVSRPASRSSTQPAFWSWAAQQTRIGV